MNTSKKFDSRAIREAGRLLFQRDSLPLELPTPKGDYCFIAILSGVGWEYGQFLHGFDFYQLLLNSKKSRTYTVDGIYSIHRTALESIPMAKCIIKPIN